MGGLLAFRVDNYNNTAEREQFRFLCERLREHYRNSDEFCIIAGNYSIGCELDAFLIKKDAIIVIEFKNYGGHVTANENGDWTCDGVPIKAGARKNVLQQSRSNHSIVKRELSIIGLDPQQIKDVPTLIVFHQPIILENKLSATTRSWLHITDDDHFLEKIDDITCPKTDLAPLGIIDIAEKLNLNPFFLKEFSYINDDSQESDATESDSENSETTAIQADKSNCEENRSEDSPRKLQELERTADNTVAGKEDKDAGDFDLKTSSDLIPLRDFAAQILKIVCGGVGCEINAVTYEEFRKLFPGASKSVYRENVVVVKGGLSASDRAHLQSFLKESVNEISPEMFFWETGDYIDAPYASSSVIKASCDPPTAGTGKIRIPDWLDKFLFGEMKAKYAPDHARFEYNLDLNKDELLIYLGTYFPRSYAEVYTLFYELFDNSSLAELLSGRESLTVLDLGCGAGGDLFGLLSLLETVLPSLKTVRLTVLDGNQGALRMFERLMSEFTNNSRLKVEYNVFPVFIEEESDLKTIADVITEKFDFIITCKAICEFAAKGRIPAKAYGKTAHTLASKLSEDGIMLIEDVTKKNPPTEEFIPITLNSELNEFVRNNPDFTTLMPAVCRKNGGKCIDGCFFKREITLAHSLKETDYTRIVYRFIGRKHLPDKLQLKEIDNIICKF